MHQEDVQDLLDRRDVLLDAIAAGASERDRPSLDAELNDVRASLAVMQPISRDQVYPTRNASPLH